MENPLFLPPEQAVKILQGSNQASDDIAPPAVSQAGNVQNPLFMPPEEAGKLLPGGSAKGASKTEEPSDPRFSSTRADAAPMEIGDVASQAWKNLPRSAGEFGHAVVQPFLHPVETAQALGKVGTGLYSKARGALGVNQEAGKKAEDEAAVDAIGDFYKQRYGTWENAKRAIAEDPIGVLSDASMVFTGGGGLAARVPGVIGEAGKIAGAVGKATDPLNIALQAPKVAAKAATSAINYPLSVYSGSEFKSLQAAHDAGLTKDANFWGTYSGAKNGTDLLDQVKGNLSDIRKEASDNLVNGMNAQDASKSLGYDIVTDALAKAKERAYKNIDPRTGIGEGRSPALEKTYQAIEDAVLGAQTNPVSKHTIVDFDNLKQSIRNYGREAARGDKDSLGMMQDVANSAKETIMHPNFGASPTYANEMEKYGSAMHDLDVLNDNLISGRKDNTKINSLLKNYKTGKNEDLLQKLYQRDPTLAPAIAGYDLSKWSPEGMRSNIMSALLWSGSGIVNPMMLLHPGHIAHIAAGSPKAVGAFNYGTGRAVALPSDIYNIAPYAPAASRLGEDTEIANRPQRASGGRISPDSKADALVRAAEVAKKDINKGTEALLEQPDETITRALAVAKKHI